MTVTLLATSDSGVGTRVALMTTSSPPPTSDEEDEAAAPESAQAAGDSASAETDRTTAEKNHLDTRQLRSDAHNTVVATGRRTHGPASPRYQRTPAGNRTTAQGGCPGSRVNARILLPKARSLSGLMDAYLPVTVAGAAAVLHRVPIKSLTGTLHVARMLRDRPACGQCRAIRGVGGPCRARKASAHPNSSSGEGSFDGTL